MSVFVKFRYFVKLYTFVLCALFVFFLQPVYASAQVVSSDEGQEQKREKRQINSTFQFNLSSYLAGSGAYYFQKKEFFGGFETWLNAHIGGKLGKNTSYFADIGVALVNAKRELLSEREQMKVLDEERDDEEGTFTRVYSYPMGYFPYSYRNLWDGFVFPISNVQNSKPGWADSTSIGLTFLIGVSGSAFDNVFEWQIARVDREAGAVAEGYSLALNKSARPFMGIDLKLNVLPWLSMYHVTGILEYFASESIKASAATFQNGFSLTMFSASFRNYIQFDIGTTAVWPKRFEIGYLFPMFHLLYQNNIGDFDNLAFFGNLKLQYPGLGFIWFSVFVDEITSEKDFLKLAREMYAYQAGLRYQIPFLPSGLLTLSYTKIEPYCYTHQKTSVPWYNQPMEQSYTNHGSGLGYYLPPNSDELKLVIYANVAPRTECNIQFQMIRHGAEYGEHKVYGSSYRSELQEDNRSRNPALRKDFLDDGAYQWLFVPKTGVKYTIKGVPATERLQMEFLFNAGVVVSYWQLNGKTLDNNQYPSRTGIIMDAGFRIKY